MLIVHCHNSVIVCFVSLEVLWCTAVEDYALLLCADQTHRGLMDQSAAEVVLEL
jgi:hypothetical protein